jgi:hypothetical protein
MEFSELKNYWLQNFIDVCHQRGLGYSEVARQSKKHPQNICEIFSRSRSCSVRYLYNLCIFMHIHPAEVFKSPSGNTHTSHQTA